MYPKETGCVSSGRFVWVRFYDLHNDLPTYSIISAFSYPRRGKKKKGMWGVTATSEGNPAQQRRHRLIAAPRDSNHFPIPLRNYCNQIIINRAINCLPRSRMQVKHPRVAWTPHPRSSLKPDDFHLQRNRLESRSGAAPPRAITALRPLRIRKRTARRASRRDAFQGPVSPLRPRQQGGGSSPPPWGLAPGFWGEAAGRLCWHRACGPHSCRQSPRGPALAITPGRK